VEDEVDETADKEGGEIGEEEVEEEDDFDALMALNNKESDAGDDVVAERDSEQAEAGAALNLANMADEVVLSPWPLRPGGSLDVVAEWEEAAQAADQRDNPEG